MPLNKETESRYKESEFSQKPNFFKKSEWLHMESVEESKPSWRKQFLEQQKYLEDTTRTTLVFIYFFTKLCLVVTKRQKYRVLIENQTL